MKRCTVLWIIVSLLLMMVVMEVEGGTTGKIAGRITDAETGEALPIAQVMVVGTTLGAAADDKGYYNIVNVPIGIYSLQVSVIGYGSPIVADVQVSADLTSRVDVALTQTAIELGSGIEVVAERPLIRRDVTYTARIMSGAEVAKTAGTESLSEVLELEPSVVRDVRSDEIHLRGGRGDEILYVIDGLPVNDKLVGGGTQLEIPVGEVEEVEIITGGFNAEYGEAQSGVVNVITKGGFSQETGELLYKSDKIAPGDIAGAKRDYVAFNLAGPEPLTGYLLPAIGVRPGGKTRFYVSGYGDFSDTYTPLGREHPAHDVLGFSLHDRQENDYGFSAKLSHRRNVGSRFTLGYRLDRSRYQRYRHEWLEEPFRGQDYREREDAWSLAWDQSLSGWAFFSLRLGSFDTRQDFAPGGKTPPQLGALLAVEESLVGPDPPAYWERGYDIDGDGFYEFGFDSLWHSHRTKIHSMKWDITAQVHQQHQAKAGLDLHYYDLEKVELLDPGIQVFSPFDDELGPWPGWGWGRDVYHVYPTSGAIYVQDKLETEGLIANLGLRYDYFMPGEQVADSITRVKGYVSPRIGLSYPVTDRDVIFMSYGHFYQMPELQYVYLTEEFRGQESLIGNPGLDPQLTVAYEVRVSHIVTSDIVAEVSLFRKDIKDLVDAEKSRVGVATFEKWQLTNSSYGEVTGLEAEIEKRYGRYLTGSASYTLSKAEGKTSRDKESFEQYELGEALKLYPLDWDQRHAIYMVADLRVGEDAPRIGPVLLPADWGINVKWRFGSGVPYTPETAAQSKGQVAKNSVTLPWTSTLDVRANKDFRFNNMILSLFVEAENLLNKENVQKANVRRGDPTRVGPPRQVASGLRLSW